MTAENGGVLSKNDKSPNPAKDGKDDPKAQTERIQGPISVVINNSPITKGEENKPPKKHERRIELLAFLAAIGGIGAAIFSGWQAWVAGDNEKRQLRAYLAVTSIGLTCPSCGNSEYKAPAQGGVGTTQDALHLVVKAASVTPAYDVHVDHLDWQYFPKNMLHPVNPTFTKYPNVANVAESRNTILPGDTKPFQTVVRVADFDAAINGKFNLLIYGTINYVDIFDRPWGADFCYIFYGNGTIYNSTFAACPYHNGDRSR
jgi:hypothetical protein